MTHVPQDRSPRRWWSDIRWLTGLVIVAIIGSVLWGLFGPEPRIIVSRATTFITEPLRPDGTPDYVAHALNLMGRGTSPDDNAAVAVLQATWPMGLDDDQLAATCAALGIPATRPDVPPLVEADSDTVLVTELQEMCRTMQPGDAAVDTAANDRRMRASLVCSEAQIRPWRTADCPPLEAWVARHSPALDIVVTAAGLPRYELPPPELLIAPTSGSLFTASLTGVQSLRTVARILATRAMHHVGEGRSAAAWSDIHAVHRLARLLSPADRATLLISQLVSVAIGASANEATLVLLDDPGLPAGEVATIRRGLDALPPRSDVAACLAMERLGALDLLVDISSTPRGKRLDAIGWGFDDLGLPLSTSLDMNVVLRGVNAAHDRLAGIATLPDRAVRRQAYEDFDRELAARHAVGNGWRRAAWILRVGTSRVARSEAVATLLEALLLPATEACVDALERSRAHFELVRVAAALAEWRARGLGGEGRPYPDRLDELVPAVVAELPSDPCSGQPFRYERRGDGYLLYSLGTNGVDDGGTSGEVRKGEWVGPGEEDLGDELLADLVVRMPRPKRSIIPPP
jgi:hypothetical protein